MKVRIAKFCLCQQATIGREGGPQTHTSHAVNGRFCCSCCCSYCQHYTIHALQRNDICSYNLVSIILAFITMANDLKCQIMSIYSFSLYSSFAAGAVVVGHNQQLSHCAVVRVLKTQYTYTSIYWVMTEIAHSEHLYAQNAYGCWRVYSLVTSIEHFQWTNK